MVPERPGGRALTAPPITLFVGLLLTACATAAWAHNYLPAPKDPGATTVIPDIAISYASYRELSAAFPVDRYRFEARAGEIVYIQMTIPRIAGLAGFTPSFALITEAADIGHLATTLREQAALVLPDSAIRSILRLRPQQSALIVDDDGSPPREFFEPFTGTRYWLRQAIRFVAPATGRYEIAVFDRNGKTGKYVLATGERERFSLRDIVGLPKVRRIVRRYMEAE